MQVHKIGTRKTKSAHAHIALSLGRPSGVMTSSVPNGVTKQQKMVLLAQIPCSCPCKEELFLKMSKSSTSFREYIHRSCGKVPAPELTIADGPKAREEPPSFYRRQCCHTPLPELKDALLAVKALDQASPERLEKLQAEATKACHAVGYSIAEVRECMDCELCTFAKAMPLCPLEWQDGAKNASYKAYVPRLAPDGKSVQNELREILCTRKELMLHLKASFEVADPHLFIEEWTSWMRNLCYATLAPTEIAISTDFSAQYDHKAAWTNTCEHPPRSNMDVFVVTRAHLVAGHRIYITDVWRIFSAAKGSSVFHNTGLAQITRWYRHTMELTNVFVFTDGCRGQYKGKRNFHRISTFPSEHSASSWKALEAPYLSFTSERIPNSFDLSAAGVKIAVQRATQGASATASSASIKAVVDAFAADGVIAQTPKPPPGWGTFPIHTVYLRHLFACGHHFKGPHDGYGKDAKFLPRTAERQQKVRLATTWERYDFDATYLPFPLHNVLAADIVSLIRPSPPNKLVCRSTDQLPSDWRC